MITPGSLAASQEPSPGRLPQPWQRYLAATRPGFLLVSLGGVGLGLVAAAGQGPVSLPLALATVFGALAAHAGINVLNDYYDHLNGGDACNDNRLFPFSGGSRVIQNGVLSARRMGLFGAALLAAVVLGGVVLMTFSGAGLFWVGLAGLLLGWAYSAPPLWLAARGLGELAVGLGFGVLLPLGAAYVQHGGYRLQPLAAGLPYALLAANILLVNQFPDAAADATCGKRTLVLRLGAGPASALYLLLAVLAGVCLLAAVAAGLLPALAGSALLAWLPVLPAWRVLYAHRDGGPGLLPAIRLTLAAALGYPLLFALSFTLR